MRKRLFILLTSILISVTVSGQTIGDISFVTENYPPYNYEENGVLKGISIDIIHAVLEKLGSPATFAEIKLLPWARGYHYLENNKNTCLFVVTKTDERASRFKWAGPVISTVIALTAKKSDNLTIDNPQDLFNYTIGVVIDDVGEQLLLSMNFPAENLQRSSGIISVFQLINMLNAGRIDMISYEQTVLGWDIEKAGLSADDYESIYILNHGELYFAFNMNTPDSVILQIQNALDELKEDGTYQEILDNYLEVKNIDL